MDSIVKQMLIAIKHWDSYVTMVFAIVQQQNIMKKELVVCIHFNQIIKSKILIFFKF